ncbi:MAG: glycoside hydrolase family 130 protein [Phycisphaeraceae bacterium]
MLERLETHCMIRPGDIAPSREDVKVVGAFNPGAAKVGDEVALLVRVAELPTQTREGYQASPRFDENGDLVVDWLEESDLEFYDPRVYHQRSTGLERLRFISYLKVFWSRDGTTIDREGPSLMPEGIYEEYGVEDPRITKIGGTYYITYVAVSRHGVSSALLSTTDFEQFQRHGIIFCPENKDVLLFPEKVIGDYLAMHRPVTSIRFAPPEMWIARSPDLIHWGSHQQLLSTRLAWQNSRIGGGTPPIKTDQGWLTLYHGSQRRENDPGPGVYTGGALLLDLQSPRRVVGYSPRPIMMPEKDFETRGFVRDVVFPTAMIERGDQYLVYYGAADENTGVAIYNRDDLLATLERPEPVEA